MISTGNQEESQVFIAAAYQLGWNQLELLSFCFGRAA